MLKVKHFTLFKLKKLKKRREFLPRLQEIFLQPNVTFKLDFNQNLVLYRMQVILGC